jgi:hypothetical protein
MHAEEKQSRFTAITPMKTSGSEKSEPAGSNKLGYQ